jgi:murein DD-endopeptidase MepM/ murein hydrolase activator NlpD
MSPTLLPAAFRGVLYASDVARIVRRVSLSAAAVMAIGACRTDDQAAPEPDSARPMVSESDFQKLQSEDTVRGLALDTLVAPVPLPSTGNVPSATRAELVALADALIIPVTGVEPDELADTFEEARGTRRHEALDILSPRGTPVVSAADGRLMKLHTSENGGLMVYAADASERFILFYAHLDRYASGLSEGMRLRRGQRLGYVGTTGNAPPNVPHLHFGIARAADVREWWKGVPIDPLPLLRKPASGAAGLTP